MSGFSGHRYGGSGMPHGNPLSLVEFPSLSWGYSSASMQAQHCMSQGQSTEKRCVSTLVVNCAWYRVPIRCPLELAYSGSDAQNACVPIDLPSKFASAVVPALWAEGAFTVVAAAPARVPLKKASNWPHAKEYHKCPDLAVLWPETRQP